MKDTVRDEYLQSLHSRLPARVYLNQEEVCPRDLQCIGAGRTGVVYRLDSERVLKIYRETVDSSKLRWLQGYDFRKLPVPCAYPRRILQDETGREVGYSSDYIAGRPFLREAFGGRSTQTAHVQRLWSLAQVLEILHGDDIALGDFSNGNFLTSGPALGIVDVDGWSIPDHRSYWHDEAVDPLYDARRQAGLLPANDTYALAHVLCRVLTRLSPYAGLYQGLDESTRALRGKSIFEPQTTKPPGYASFYRQLPANVRKYFRAVFRHEVRVLPDETFWKELTNWVNSQD